jgi:hypothetical protein
MKLAGWVLIALGLVCILQYVVVEALHTSPLPERLSLAISLMSIALILGGLGLMSVKRLKRRLEAPAPTAQELARRLWRLCMLFSALGAIETAIAADSHGARRWTQALIALLYLSLALFNALQARGQSRRAVSEEKQIMRET